MSAFPNAKVILTVRDNPEVWHKSVEESIYHGSKISQQVGFINSKFDYSFMEVRWDVQLNLFQQFESNKVCLTDKSD